MHKINDKIIAFLDPSTIEPQALEQLQNISRDTRDAVMPDRDSFESGWSAREAKPAPADEEVREAVAICKGILTDGLPMGLAWRKAIRTLIAAVSDEKETK